MSTASAESAIVQLAGDGRRGAYGPGSERRARREYGGQASSRTETVGVQANWKSTDPEGRLRDENILILDDCTLDRENLAAIFTLNNMAAPSVAWDLPSLVRALEEAEPSVALVNLATRDSALLLRAAMGISPQLRVIVLGASEDDETEIVACAEAGVAGYHMRADSLNDLLALICKVTDGETSCSPAVSAILLRRLSSLASQRLPAARELDLTKRETQILRLLELGRSNQDIAVQLSIAVHTVKNHVHSLLTKLGVRTRAEAAALSRAVRLHPGSTHPN
jgi:DNA-binding NarL/FixJ family response regulator